MIKKFFQKKIFFFLKKKEMPRQLPADCLNEIFEYLENDKATLFSCLLVNRLWCEISVRILWRIVWNCSTLIACLPSESKEILCKNGFTISTLTGLTSK